MALRVDPNTEMKMWDSKLHLESLSQDIFTQISGVYSDRTKVIPNSIITKVTGFKKGTHEVTIPLLRKLSGTGITGRTAMSGNEEDQVMESLTVYANLFANAVPYEQYGIDAWDMKHYDVISKIQQQLSTWHKEQAGKYIREALCEKYSGNLVDGPISLTQHFNSNIAFANDGVLNIATYDDTLATYTTNILTAENAATGGTQDSGQRLSIDHLNAIIEYATSTIKMNPVNVSVNGGARDMYILTVPSRQKKFLLTASANSYFELLKDADVRGPNNQAISYALGSYGNLLLVEDPRAPQVEAINGSTVTFEYDGPTDGRTSTTANDMFDVAMLLGEGALFEFCPEPLHFREEIQDYERNKGIGAFQTCGWVLGEFDKVTADDAVYNRNSALIMFGQT